MGVREEARDGGREEWFRAPALCGPLPLLGLRRAICHTRVLTLQPLEVSWWMRWRQCRLVGWEHGLWGTPKLSLLLPISVWNLLLSWCSCLTLRDPHHDPQGLLPRGPREASGKPPLSLSSRSGVIRALLPRSPSWTGQSCLGKCAAWPSLARPTALNYNKIRLHSMVLLVLTSCATLDKCPNLSEPLLPHQ